MITFSADCKRSGAFFYYSLTVNTFHGVSYTECITSDAVIILSFRDICLIACGKNRIFFVAERRISRRIFGISFINANFQKLFFYGIMISSPAGGYPPCPVKRLFGHNFMDIPLFSTTFLHPNSLIDHISDHLNFHSSYVINAVQLLIGLICKLPNCQYLRCQKSFNNILCESIWVRMGFT